MHMTNVTAKFCWPNLHTKVFTFATESTNELLINKLMYTHTKYKSSLLHSVSL